MLRELEMQQVQEERTYDHSDKIPHWLERILGHEGNYFDDPVGGPTRWGISKRAYPNLDIKNLTLQQAVGIYKEDYMKPLQVERFRDGVAFQLLDFAVNSNQKNAIISMQTVLQVKPDGNCGPITLAAIRAKSEAEMIMLILAARLLFMSALKNWPENSKGWVRRIAKNLLYGASDIQ